MSRCVMVVPVSMDGVEEESAGRGARRRVSQTL